MGMERRGSIDQALEKRTTGTGRNLLERAKPYNIPREWFGEAFRRVKANQGMAEIGRAHV